MTQKQSVLNDLPPLLFQETKNFHLSNTRIPGAEQVDRALREYPQVGLIYLDVVKFHEVEQIAGREACARILQFLQKTVLQAASRVVPAHCLLGVHKLNGDDFVVYFTGGPETAASIPEINQLAQHLRQVAKDMLCDRLASLWPELDLRVGYTFITPSPARSLKSQLYSGIKEALRVAREQPDVNYLQKIHELREILAHRALQVVFQPVVSLFSGEVTGYEALTRGPEGSYFASPTNLFAFAQEAGLLFEAEKLARELAIARLSDFQRNQKLFLNINPRVLEAPGFATGETRRILEAAEQSCQSVVFEITERTSIENYPRFVRALEHYRSQGFLVAVDDAGAGHSNLKSIAEFKPDYIKIDMSLVRDIDRSSTKQALMEAFILFSQRINAQIIAEGIETEEELRVLCRLGIPLGQGFLLARPGYPLPLVEPDATVLLSAEQEETNRSSSYRGVTIGSIAERGLTLDCYEPASQADQLFENNPEINNIMVVCGQSPRGLVTRDRFYRQLATRFGRSLFLDRPVTRLMDGNPLMVDKSLQIEAVSRMATGRGSRNLYDDIVVIDGDTFIGTVSVRKLLNVITKMQVESARFANPLTGLPGNVKIEEEIQSRLAVPDQSFALIYADLDGFKAFNDRYGFERGDQAILLTARILSHVVTLNGDDSEFVGHVGGDDFVLITDPRHSEQVCSRIIQQFDDQIPSLYDQEELAAGGISAVDRQGRQHFYPIMSISLAVVTNEQRKFTSHLAMGEVAAELKHRAKNIAGSCYVCDRRL
jgi:diguanylate cyclase (GGDEF)-like protein